MVVTATSSATCSTASLPFGGTRQSDSRCSSPTCPTRRLEDFDFSQQPSIDRRLVDELATGRFLDEGRNLVFLGPPGVGKTHLGIALGMVTAQLGFRIYFTSAIDMARRMAKAMAEGKLAREMNNLVRLC